MSETTSNPLENFPSEPDFIDAVMTNCTARDEIIMDLLMASMTDRDRLVLAVEMMLEIRSYQEQDGYDMLTAARMAGDRLIADAKAEMPASLDPIVDKLLAEREADEATKTSEPEPVPDVAGQDII